MPRSRDFCERTHRHCRSANSLDRHGEEAKSNCWQSTEPAQIFDNENICTKQRRVRGSGRVPAGIHIQRIDPYKLCAAISHSLDDVAVDERMLIISRGRPMAIPTEVE